jgi:hypothetical protein
LWPQSPQFFGSVSVSTPGHAERAMSVLTAASSPVSTWPWRLSGKPQPNAVKASTANSQAPRLEDDVRRDMGFLRLRRPFGAGSILRREIRPGC